MRTENTPGQSHVSRRSFFKRGSLAGVAAGIPLVGIMSSTTKARAAVIDSVTPGDIAMLRFLAAAELV